MALDHPDAINKYVGARLKAARKTAGVSMEDLAETVGITFQQVQKYENGTNRVSPGYLVHFAAKLDVPVWWFFGDSPAIKPDQIAGLTDFFTKPHASALAGAFLDINDEDRRRLTDLAVRFKGGADGSV